MHMLKVFCVTLQTDEACGRSVHQRIQQTPRAALGAEVPGVSDREAGQVGDLQRWTGNGRGWILLSDQEKCWDCRSFFLNLINYFPQSHRLKKGVMWSQQHPIWKKIKKTFRMFLRENTGACRDICAHNFNWIFLNSQIACMSTHISDKSYLLYIRGDIMEIPFGRI